MSISIILNIYKRSYLINDQINSILDQTIKVNENNIHIWYNKTNSEPCEIKFKKVKTYKANWNTKFWGRFCLPLLLNSKYTAIFDDDTLPEKGWLENCMKSMTQQEGIYGPTGVVLTEKSYSNIIKYGWNTINNEESVEVDFVGQSWFFKTKWVKYMWFEKPFTWDNGEDIFFSYQAKKYGNIKTYVAPHPENKKSLWGSKPEIGNTAGYDKNATWLKPNHKYLRSKVIEYCINNGWETINRIE